MGAGPAAEYISYLRVARQWPNLDAILADPKNAPIPDEPSVVYAVAIGLAAKANEVNYARVKTYCERLHKAELGEYATLLVRDSVRRNPRVTSTRAYIELTSGDVGKLMTGRAT